MEEAIERLLSLPENKGLGAPALKEILADEEEIYVPVKKIKEYLQKRGGIEERIGGRADLRLASRLRHFSSVTRPNDVHQADLLFMPTDPRTKEKYALIVEDTASRYKAAVGLKSKTAKEVKQAFQKIYRDTDLKPPRVLRTDGGAEYGAEVASMFRKEHTKISTGASGQKTHIPMVDSFARLLGKRLFARQHEEEQEEGGVSRKWSDILQAVVSRLNKTKTRETRLKPIDSIHKSFVSQPGPSAEAKKIMRTETVIKVGTPVRYPLDAPPEKGRWRETDLRWSSVMRVKEILDLPDQVLQYKLDGGPNRWWTGKHLKLAG